ncbi:hypothetical protein N7456_000640 [Penicillium angulare]|uniref:BTB domain-containing protein n=1 Tax=Penicillium angulare TaxID=116970 RepID=A0A9W9GCJ2_9EURO|nr:hypothetical protein N7456_000640 [Penicillium angulare]
MASTSLAAIVKTLHDSGKYSDMTIVCEGKIIPVHRAIVCTQSPFFAAALEGGRFKESITSQIELPEDNLPTIERVMSYLYTRHYDAGEPDTRHSDENINCNNLCEAGIEGVLALRDHLKVYIAADKFGILPLKKYAKTRLIKRITYASYATLSRAVDYVWTTVTPVDTDSEVRKALTEGISSLVHSFPYSEGSFAFLRELPDISIAVIKQMACEYRILDSQFVENLIVVPPPGYKMIDGAPQDRRRRNLLHTGKDSDLTISCGGQNIAVHRSVLCRQSPFFEAAFNGNFKIFVKEAITSHLNLPEDDLGTIHRVLCFLYFRRYDEIKPTTIQGTTCDPLLEEGMDSEFPIALRNNLKVFVAADKFDIKTLTALAKSRLLESIRTTDFTKCPMLIQEIWSTVPPFENDVRDTLICRLSASTFKSLVDDENFAMFADIPDILLAALKYVVVEITKRSGLTIGAFY